MDRYEITPNERYQVWAEIRVHGSLPDYETEMINSYSDPRVAEHARHILVSRPGSFVERAWVEDVGE